MPASPVLEFSLTVIVAMDTPIKSLLDGPATTDEAIEMININLVYQPFRFVVTFEKSKM